MEGGGVPLAPRLPPSVPSAPGPYRHDLTGLAPRPADRHPVPVQGQRHLVGRRSHVEVEMQNTRALRAYG
jgi:hypothetical protein